MFDLEEIGMAIVLLVTVVFSLVGALMACATLYSLILGPMGCTSYGEKTGLVTDYDFIEGCFVTLEDGRAVPKDYANKSLIQLYGDD